MAYGDAPRSDACHLETPANAPRWAGWRNPFATPMTAPGLELVKWLALGIMAAEHVNWVLLGGAHGWMTDLGRIGMPMFASVFAFNLARPSCDADTLRRSVRRLLLVGALAQVGYVFAFDRGLFPLNILFAFAIAAQCVQWGRGDNRTLAWVGIPLLLFASLWVEFALVAVLLTLAWVAFFRAPAKRWPLVIVATALLCGFNANGWAMLSIPVMALLFVPVRIPRTRRFFYAFYPVHLAVLALVAEVPDPE